MGTLSERDKALIWHPLTQHKNQKENLGISSAKGCLLVDENGNTYIDGISSWYTAMYGHCNPEITEKVARQMNRLDQIVFSGFTHQPAVDLADKLLEVLPENQTKVFFSDNGSTAVEVALKMALQYYHNKGEKRDTFIAFHEGFHGDTFGALSVSGLSVYNGPFEKHGLNVIRIPVPEAESLSSILEEVSEILQQHKVAGFIYEPLVQGAAAMKMHNPEDLDPLLKFLRANDVLLIADEVMTGFGKTGTFFASEQIATFPDLICLSKSLTAGLLPMAVTSCTEEIFQAFYADEVAKGFFHGHTYTANPLACTAALAGLELLRSENIQKKIKQINQWHKAFEIRIEDHPKVETTRCTGVIFALDLAIETDRYGSLRDRMYRHFLDAGVYLRPLGSTIYILPPFVISKVELQHIYDSIVTLLDSL